MIDVAEIWFTFLERLGATVAEAADIGLTEILWELLVGKRAAEYSTGARTTIVCR